MKNRITVIFILILILFTFNISAQSEEFIQFPVIDSVYIPMGSAASGGNGIFTGPLANTARTYQLLINETELTALMGKEIKGISFRSSVSATTTWPPAEVTYNNYDLYLSGSVAPANRSLVFAENIIGQQKMVRSGSLLIRPESYPIGGNPNYCGSEISFDTAYLYMGGHLLIELRQNASNGTSRGVDAWTTSSSGYGTLYSACWVGSYTGTSGSQGNFSIIKLTYDDPVPVELTSFTAFADGRNVNLSWITATESNNSGFQVQRFSGEKWTNIGFVNGNGSTTEISEYKYCDRNLSPGNYTYRLKQIDFDGASSYSDQISAEISNPVSYELGQNYPNPFNPSTKIEFSVKETSPVKIILYNSIGEVKAVLLDETREAGFHSINFDASSFAAGVYFYEMRSNNFSQVKKMMLLK